MSLEGLQWADTSAYDIHLLPGLVSPELKRLLRPTDFDPAKKLTLVKTFSQMADVKVSFAAQFAGAPDNHGVKMDPDNGAVTVSGLLPSGPMLRSFIITATGTQGAGAAKITVKARIRVNIHNAITKIWLTPARLTVRKDARNMRFSLLAQFDDGIIGDITNWSPFSTPGSPTDFTFVHAVGSETPVVKWSEESVPANAPVVVTADPVTGELRASAETGRGKITARLLNKTATAEVVCGKPWSTPIKLTHLSGPGAREAGSVPNILFLPDGFEEKDEKEFERLIRFAVGRLTRRNRTRPFAALTGRINYFYAWVPSPDGGISVLEELDRTVLSATTAEGNGIESPSRGRGPAGRWSLENLINEVGLPTPAGDPLMSALDQARIDAWQKLYGTQVTMARMGHLFNSWLSRNDRVILNERDTAFHMAFGSRPALDGATAGHSISFNLRRLANDDFNAFLSNLRGPTGLGLSDIWAGKGKDNKFIVIVCRSAHVGGVNSPRPDDGATIGVSLARKPKHKMQVNAQGNGFDLTPDPIPKDPDFNVWMTAAHELGHSCGLGDEYGGTATPPLPGNITSTATEANVQDHDSLLVGSSISPDKIKWNAWPRIAKAGVLLINPKPVAGGKFALVVRDQNATRIKRGDIVRLRTRPLATALPPTGRFKVESVGDEIVIVPLPGTTLDPAKFPAGSIVMVPVRLPDSNPAANFFGLDLTFADDEVTIRIAMTGNPLNAQPLKDEAPDPVDDPARACKGVELPIPTAATNFPNRKAPKSPVFSSWNIGLFENGGEHNCGIYRPTGICVMSHTYKPDPRTNVINIYDFCIICRYAIVDALDPTRHGEVEIDFVSRYGKRGAP